MPAKRTVVSGRRKRGRDGGSGDESPRKKPRVEERGKNEKKKCEHCSCTDTPLWRVGPGGLNTLCNACGLHYKKHGNLAGRSATRPAKSKRGKGRAAHKRVVLDTSSSDEEKATSSSEYDSSEDDVEPATAMSSGPGLVDSASELQAILDSINELPDSVVPYELREALQDAVTRLEKQHGRRTLFVGLNGVGKSFIINLMLMLTARDPVAYKMLSQGKELSYVSALRESLRASSATEASIAEKMEAVDVTTVDDDFMEERGDIAALRAEFKKTVTHGQPADVQNAYLLPSQDGGSRTTVTVIRIREGHTFHAMVEYYGEEWCRDAAALYPQQRSAYDADIPKEAKKAMRERYHLLAEPLADLDEVDLSDSDDDDDDDDDDNDSEQERNEREYRAKDITLRKEIVEVAGRIRVFAGAGEDFDRDRQFVRAKLLELSGKGQTGPAKEAANRQRAALKSVTLFVPCSIVGKGGEILDAPGLGDTDPLNKQMLHEAVEETDDIVCIAQRGLGSEEALYGLLKEEQFFSRLLEDQSAHLSYWGYTEKVKLRRTLFEGDSTVLKKSLQDSHDTIQRDTMGKFKALLKSAISKRNKKRKKSERIKDIDDVKWLESRTTILNVYPVLFTSLLLCGKTVSPSDRTLLDSTSGFTLLSLLEWIGERACAKSLQDLPQMMEKILSGSTVLNVVDDSVLCDIGKRIQILFKKRGRRAADHDAKMTKVTDLFRTFDDACVELASQTDPCIETLLNSLTSQVPKVKATLQRNRQHILDNVNPKVMFKPAFYGRRPYKYSLPDQEGKKNGKRLFDMLLPCMDSAFGTFLDSLLSATQSWAEQIIKRLAEALLFFFVREANGERTRRSDHRTTADLPQNFIIYVEDFVRETYGPAIMARATKILSYKTRWGKVTVLKNALINAHKKAMEALLHKVDYFDRTGRKKKKVSGCLDDIIAEIEDHFESLVKSMKTIIKRRLNEQFKFLKRDLFALDSKHIGCGLFVQLCSRIAKGVEGDLLSDRITELLPRAQWVVDRVSLRAKKLKDLEQALAENVERSLILTHFTENVRDWELPKKVVARMHVNAREFAKNRAPNDLLKMIKHANKATWDKKLAKKLIRKRTRDDGDSLFAAVALAVWGEPVVRRRSIMNIAVQKGESYGKAVIEASGATLTPEDAATLAEQIDASKRRPTIDKLVEMIREKDVKNVMFLRYQVAVEVEISRHYQQTEGKKWPWVEDTVKIGLLGGAGNDERYLHIICAALNIRILLCYSGRRAFYGDPAGTLGAYALEMDQWEPRRFCALVPKPTKTKPGPHTPEVAKALVTLKHLEITVENVLSWWGKYRKKQLGQIVLTPRQHGAVKILLQEAGPPRPPKPAPKPVPPPPTPMPDHLKHKFSIVFDTNALKDARVAYNGMGNLFHELKQYAYAIQVVVPQAVLDEVDWRMKKDEPDHQFIWREARNAMMEYQTILVTVQLTAEDNYIRMVVDKSCRFNDHRIIRAAAACAHGTTPCGVFTADKLMHLSAQGDSSVCLKYPDAVGAFIRGLEAAKKPLTRDACHRAFERI